MRACKQITRFFYTKCHPFNCAKNQEFPKRFDLVGRYGVGFKQPSYHEIREKFLKKEVDNTMSLLDEHKTK